jgi:hypothetical protein
VDQQQVSGYRTKLARNSRWWPTARTSGAGFTRWAPVGRIGKTLAVSAARPAKAAFSRVIVAA